MSRRNSRRRQQAMNADRREGIRYYGIFAVNPRTFQELRRRFATRDALPDLRVAR